MHHHHCCALPPRCRDETRRAELGGPGTNRKKPGESQTASPSPSLCLPLRLSAVMLIDSYTLTQACTTCLLTYLPTYLPACLPYPPAYPPETPETMG